METEEKKLTSSEIDQMLEEAAAYHVEPKEPSNKDKKNKKKKKKLTGPVIAKKTMFITGMHCEHCVQSVTDSLNRIDGVSARVDLNKSCAEISLDREIGEDILICAVEKAGFLVESIQS